MTAIEWPDEPWNPVDDLDAPLRWRKPRRVFVNSMIDLFHEDVPDEFIDRVFAVMALAPQHTFQILTKRPGRMRRYLTGDLHIQRWNVGEKFLRMSGAEARRSDIRCAITERDVEGYNRVGGLHWPLPNVWLGVSVEDQRAADERIPLLLETPAAVRFVSCEPLLGALDLQRWLRPSKRLHLRASVEGMLRNKTFAGLTDESGNAMSRAQAEQRLRSMLAEGVQYLRVGECDGFDPASGCPGHAEPKVNWVICGGESGPRARPCRVDWIRSIVEQCKAAGVACFVKQLGGLASAFDAKREWFDGCNFHRGGFARIRLRSRKGSDPSEWPEDLCVREFPR
ncbi:MAG: hypothetical protein RIS45_544 [Planctomycetota bacterium]|jgi:protein gp37